MGRLRYVQIPLFQKSVYRIYRNFRGSVRSSDGAVFFGAVHAEFHQTRFLRSARSHRVLCLGTCVGSVGLSDQKFDQCDYDHYGRRRRIEQLHPRRAVCRTGRSDLQEKARPRRRVDRVGRRLGDHGRAQPADQLLHRLPRLRKLHADRGDRRHVSRDLRRRERLVGMPAHLQHAVYHIQGALVRGDHLPHLQADKLRDEDDRHQDARAPL